MSGDQQLASRFACPEYCLLFLFVSAFADPLFPAALAIQTLSRQRLNKPRPLPSSRAPSSRLQRITRDVSTSLAAGGHPDLPRSILSSTQLQETSEAPKGPFPILFQRRHSRRFLLAKSGRCLLKELPPRLQLMPTISLQIRIFYPPSSRRDSSARPPAPY